jgi:hypothetical protein
MVFKTKVVIGIFLEFEAEKLIFESRSRGFFFISV